MSLVLFNLWWALCFPVIMMLLLWWALGFAISIVNSLVSSELYHQLGIVLPLWWALGFTISIVLPLVSSGFYHQHRVTSLVSSGFYHQHCVTSLVSSGLYNQHCLARDIVVVFPCWVLWGSPSLYSCTLTSAFHRARGLRVTILLLLPCDMGNYTPSWRLCLHVLMVLCWELITVEDSPHRTMQRITC